MNKLSGVMAVAGATLFGVLAVLGAMHFRDNAEVPKWTPPSASLAMPMMAQLAQPEPARPPPVRAPAPMPPPAPAPPVVQPPTQVVEAPLPQPPPPATRTVAEAIRPPDVQPAPPLPDLEDIEGDDELAQAQRKQIQAAQLSRLRTLDIAHNRRMLRGPRPGAPVAR